MSHTVIALLGLAIGWLLRKLIYPIRCRGCGNPWGLRKNHGHYYCARCGGV